MNGGGNVPAGDGQHQHFIIGEQIFLDRFSESDTVNLFPVYRLIIHRTQISIRFPDLIFDLIGEFIQSRGGGHIHPLAPLQKIVVMDADKGAFIITALAVAQRYAGRAVRFVADNQIENRAPGFALIQKALRLRHFFDGLVCRKYDGHPLRAGGALFVELAHDGRDIG